MDGDIAVPKQMDCVGIPVFRVRTGEEFTVIVPLNDTSVQLAPVVVTV
jgi:hypothetical protein